MKDYFKFISETQMNSSFLIILNYRAYERGRSV